MNGKETSYRGIYRKEPEYPEQKTEEMDIWKRSAYARWDIKKYSAFIRDIDDATRLFTEYVGLGKQVDLLKVILADEEINIEKEKNQFIGYDVATFGCYSAIADRPVAWDANKINRVSDDKELIAWPLWKLEGRYFSPRLNESGLFQNWVDAELFMNVEQSLSRIFPEFYEKEFIDMNVFALFLIFSA